MKTIFLWLAVAALAMPLPAQTLAEKYADGDVFVLHLASAPFPHPDRAQGHVYHDEHFTAEKNYSDNSVGIFVPKGFRPAAAVDFVVHFHGWRNHVAKVFDDYQLVEQFARSGRNAILIIPQGPYDVPDSFYGKLEDENGFHRFMADVMAALRERGVIGTAPLGQIILSGHSGGYQVMSSIVAQGGLSEHVREVWLFDALYARAEKFTAWFKRYPHRRLIDIYTLHGGTKTETENLMASLKAAKTPFISKNEPDITDHDLRRNRLIFIYTGLEHNQVVSAHGEFCDFLKTSGLAPVRLFASPKAAGE